MTSFVHTRLAQFRDILLFGVHAGIMFSRDGAASAAIARVAGILSRREECNVIDIEALAPKSLPQEFASVVVAE